MVSLTYIETTLEISLRCSECWTQHVLPGTGRPSWHNRPPITSWHQPRTAHDSSQFSVPRSHMHIGRSSRSRWV